MKHVNGSHHHLLFKRTTEQIRQHCSLRSIISLTAVTSKMSSSKQFTHGLWLGLTGSIQLRRVSHVNLIIILNYKYFIKISKKKQFVKIVLKVCLFDELKVFWRMVNYPDILTVIIRSTAIYLHLARASYRRWELGVKSKNVNLRLGRLPTRLSSHSRRISFRSSLLDGAGSTRYTLTLPSWSHKITPFRI